ncbi:MAG TPA: PilZ domain-containing protein, partial [Terriglobales bacterium]|nr:PilZ domain-containing protein [Terriglobales bacterium]
RFQPQRLCLPVGQCAFSNLRGKGQHGYHQPMATALSPQPSVGFARKRRWERNTIDVPVRLIFWNSLHTAKIVDARGRDMSEGGMAVFAGVELRIGDVVEVEFTPAYSGQPMRVKAEVRNRRGYSYGTEFLTDTAAEQTQAARLRELLISASGKTSA